ncbi:hypothetical protein TNCV_4266061 [Trichonephila clavipes]|nr:hypothetical protein TNCV_4266061 [Trichonephila clavipes]
MARVSNEGRKVRSGYLPFRTNASTLPIMPKRSSSRDVGTSSYRYHTATYYPASVSRIGERTIPLSCFLCKIRYRGSIVVNVTDSWLEFESRAAEHPPYKER